MIGGIQANPFKVRKVRTSCMWRPGAEAHESLGSTDVVSSDSLFISNSWSVIKLW